MKRSRLEIDSDSMVARNRGLRWAVFGATMFVVALFPALIGIYLGSIISFSGSQFLFGMSGFLVGLSLTMKIFPHFWVVVPQTSTFVTTLLFNKNEAGSDPNVAYGPGGHPALPWEMREESGNITLDIFTLPFTETVPTKDSAVIVDGKVQFKFSLSHIKRVIGIDESTIQGFMAQINEFISDDLEGKSGEDAKKEVKELRQRLEHEFEENPERTENLLDEYGIRVTGFQISSIDFPKAVQDARDVGAVGEGFRAAVLKSLGCSNEAELDQKRKDGHITPERERDAENNILLNLNKGKLNLVRGLEGAGDASKIAGAILAQGGGK